MSKEINNLTVHSLGDSVRIGVTNFVNILGADVTYHSNVLDKDEIDELIVTLQAIRIKKEGADE